MKDVICHRSFTFMNDYFFFFPLKIREISVLLILLIIQARLIIFVFFQSLLLGNGFLASTFFYMIWHMGNINYVQNEVYLQNAVHDNPFNIAESLFCSCLQYIHACNFVSMPNICPCAVCWCMTVPRDPDDCFPYAQLYLDSPVSYFLWFQHLFRRG